MNFLPFNEFAKYFVRNIFMFTAAKTLAIIVGLFILCWLPFFTLYLIRPFCEDCINQILFSVVFWIGYCNSAINPMIYALFSKDFRFAFKQIICKCFCSGNGFAKPSSRRGSDMSAFRHHSGGQRTPSISPSQLAQSIGDDSDPISEDLHRWRSFAPSISSSYASSSLGGRHSININSSSVNNSNLCNSNNNGMNGSNNSMGNMNVNRSESKINLGGMNTNGSGGNASNVNSSNIRAASIYDICHPLVM